MAISSLDIAWLAGLLEGEGCFHIGKRKVKDKMYKRVIISLAMTDKEPVERAAKLFNTKVTTYKNKRYDNKLVYKTVVWASDVASAWMMTLYSFMSPRRKAKIAECLAVWKLMPGRGGVLSQTT